MPAIKSLNELLKQFNRDSTTQVKFPESVPLTQFFYETIRGDYIAKGTGLAITGNGIIDLTGQIPHGAVIEKVFLYWEVVRANDEINPEGMLNGTPISGELIGTVKVYDMFVDGYRADVTGIGTAVLNMLTNFPNAMEPVTITEGASLVVVYSRNDLPYKTVMINDGIQVFQNETMLTSFKNFNVEDSTLQAKTTYIIGEGDSALYSAAFNGISIVSENNPIEAEGAFWDTLNIDVTHMANTEETIADASIRSMSYILGWIAQVFSVTAALPSVEVPSHEETITVYPEAAPSHEEIVSIPPEPGTPRKEMNSPHKEKTPPRNEEVPPRLQRGVIFLE
jgi:hypothetical protein